MWSMNSFADEYVKIAASAAAAKNPKSRIGRRPIRAHNLVKKANVKAETAKATAGGMKNLLSRMWASKYTKPGALLATGALAGKGAEEYFIEPWQYGRRAQAMGVQL